jgi:ferrochelatase
MAQGSRYVEETTESGGGIAAILGAPSWSVAYQSRSGDGRTPWLEPDINDAINELPESVSGLVVSAIGFVSDHMEVLWDLDNEALETAGERGLPMVRVPTVGVDPGFVSGLVDLIEERTAGNERPALTELGPWQDVCPTDCCLGRAPKPTIASC